MALTSVFLMDPVHGIDIEADSTFVLMMEAQDRGHTVYVAHPRDLELRQGDPWVWAQKTTLQRVQGEHAAQEAPIELALNQVDVVYLRKDPPFDEAFLGSTWILDRVDRSRVVCVNDPQGVRDFNEKLSALHFPELLPPSMVSANRKNLRAFIAREEKAVVKPLMGAGGAGIVLLEHGDRNIGSVLDILTQEGKVAIEAQRYLPDVTAGDKRIVLLDGKPIGAINRVPAADDIRANMHVGGAAHGSKRNERDEDICARLGPELSRRGLEVVGIDVIGGWLTEGNVTSPTGLQEINRFDNVRLEAQILDWVAARAG